MADFHLHLLGVPELRTAKGEPVYFRTRKHFGLLVYLALEARDRGVPRDRLIELFWPDAPYERARHSLSQGLSAIRGSLGVEALSKGGRHVQLLCAIESDLDRPARARDDSGIAAPTPLDGLDDAGGAEFGHWLDGVRHRLVTAVRRAVSSELQDLRDAGDHQQVQERAAWLYRIDPKNETAVQVLAERALAEGDTEGAVAIWEDFGKRINDADKMESTRQLIERIRAKSTSHRKKSHRPTSTRSNSTFVGRHTEIARLQCIWEELVQDETCTCLIEGAPGIGKTALVKRFEAFAATTGHITIRTQCHPIDAEIPFAALSSLIIALSNDPDLGATDPRWLSEASRFAPDLRRRFSGIPEPTPRPGDAGRLMLAESLARIIETIAGGLPALIVIDDIHNLDPASRDVVHVLSRKSSSSPILIVGVQRAADGVARMRQRPSPAELISWNHSIRVGPLNSYDSQSLIHEMTRYHVGHSAYESIVQTIDQLSDGRPYFIELLCNDWIGKGDQALVVLGAHDQSNAIADWTPSDAMRAAFGHHILSLSYQARCILEYLAILGKPADPEEIAELSGYPIAEVQALLGDILAFGTLVLEGPKVAFKNEAHRAFIYHAMTEATRSLHHSQVGRFVTRRMPDNPSRLFESAHHYRLAGAHDHALTLTVTGAKHALQHGGSREAEAAIRASMRESDEIPPKVLALLVESLNAQGRFREALDTIKSIDTGALNPAAIARVNILRCEAMVRGCIGSWRDTREVVERTLSDVSNVADDEIRSRALLVSAEYCAASRDWDALNAVASVALTVASSNKDSLTDAYRDLVVGFCEASRGQYQNAIERFTSSAARLRDAGSPKALPRALHGVGCCAMLSGAFAWARDAFTRAKVHAQESGDAPFVSNVLNNLAVLNGDLGDFVAADRYFDEAIRMNRVVPHDRYEAVILCNKADLELVRGNTTTGNKLMTAAAELIARSQPATKHLQWIVGQADFAINDRNFNALLALIDQAFHAVGSVSLSGRPPASPWDPPHLSRSKVLADWLRGCSLHAIPHPMHNPAATHSVTSLVEATLTYEWIAERTTNATAHALDGSNLVRSTGLYGVAYRLGRLGLLPRKAFNLFAHDVVVKSDCAAPRPERSIDLWDCALLARKANLEHF